MSKCVRGVCVYRGGRSVARRAGNVCLCAWELRELCACEGRYFPCKRKQCMFVYLCGKVVVGSHAYQE